MFPWVRRLGVIGRTAAKATALVVAIVLLALVVAVGLLYTDWGRDELRTFLVGQANKYLTATLEIGALEGSLYRGIDLRDVSLSRAGRTLVRIDAVSLAYDWGVFQTAGTVIREVRITRPYVLAEKEEDGRWNLAALVRRQNPDAPRGAPRPIRIESLEVTDGVVELADAVTFGAVHVPTRFEAINVALSFDRGATGWHLSVDRVSAIGTAPELTMNRISGGMSGGSEGLGFESFSIQTPQSAVTLDGRINRGTVTTLDLDVMAARFTFQEWAGIVSGLRNIAVDSQFETKLSGPLDHLAVALDFSSTAGNISGMLTLNTRVPGWHAAGALRVARLNLADWLSRQNDRSDISGNVEFDLDLDLGRHFPRGSYSFQGPNVAFAGYQANNLRAKGTITASDVLIQEAIAIAYGANVGLSKGSIGVDRPFPFRFEGRASGVDLRRVPGTVPVPHVESALAFDYDVRGQFSSPFIAGNVAFAESMFLGASVGDGTVGTLDTSTRPLTYTGEGDLSGVDLQRFAKDLDLTWLQNPRYSGAISGRFRVNAAGSGADSLSLAIGGHLMQGSLFGGSFSNAELTLDINAGSLEASYDGRFEGVDPSIALDDRQFAASLSGSGSARLSVRDLLNRTPTLEDYAITGDVALLNSTVRDVDLDSASITATLSGGTLDITKVQGAGPAVAFSGSGVVEFDGTRSSEFDYTVERADLSLLHDLAGRDLAGRVETTGRMTGPTDALRFAGNATTTDVAVDDIQALSATAAYDVTVPSSDIVRVSGEATLRASSIKLFGREILEAEGTFSYANQRLAMDAQITPRENLVGRIAGAALVHDDAHAVDVTELALALERMDWRLVTTDPPPTVAWTGAGIDVGPMSFVDGAGGAQRLGIAGSWRSDGSGSLRLSGNGVFLDTLTVEQQGPADYGGRLDFEATVTGTREQPIVTGSVSITDGRVRRLSYERLEGRVGYFDDQFEINLRLDQAPGVWLTAAGTLPLGLFDPDQPERPMYLAVASTPIGLGLIEGLTDVVRDVTGDARLNVTVAGTSHRPDYIGAIEINDAGFLVTANGARYDKGHAVIDLTTERITVSAFQLADRRGRLLDVRGSLGTRELRLQDLELEVTAKGFEVLRNEFGTLDADMQLNVLGRMDSPRVTGALTVVGGEIAVNEILGRTLFAPYATEALPSITNPDTVVTTRAWDRIGIDVAVRIPGTLRMVGEDVQVSPGTPLGLGDINLRATGDVFLYKDPGQPLYVTGSLDQITGTYAFQGRRFDLDPSSSINFRGDLIPEAYVTVRSLISGVETTVSLIGPLSELELRLASNPPLDPSDVLSLIVFNTTTNGLSGAQQEQLAVRAGTLAAAFLANPLVSTLERTLGLETLAIEPGTGTSSGARLTIGEEIAPGLIARFSRQFGQEQYDEASLEYYLSRILRLRATFSDAAGLISNSPFRRVERAGVDLLVFLSF